MYFFVLFLLMYSSNLGCVQGDCVITFKCIALIYTELPRSCKPRLLKKRKSHRCKQGQYSIQNTYWK